MPKFFRIIDDKKKEKKQKEERKREEKEKQKKEREEKQLAETLKKNRVNLQTQFSINSLIW